jgi:predicted RNA binding protein YcfA (HicA-like mRNA interferase family)
MNEMENSPQEELQSIDLNDDGESDSLSDDDVKEKEPNKDFEDRKSSSSSSRRKKSNLIIVDYDTSGVRRNRTKPEKSHGYKRRKILTKLTERGFFGTPGKGSHQNITHRSDDQKKTTLPSHGTIKKGTLGSIQKAVGRI